MSLIKSKEDFAAFVADFQERNEHQKPMVFGIGRRVFTPDGTLASVRYPLVNGPSKYGPGENLGTFAVIAEVLGLKDFNGMQHVDINMDQIHQMMKYYKPFEGDEKPHPNIKLLKTIIKNGNRGGLVASFMFTDEKITSVEDATLKLYTTSNLHYTPRELNYDGIFAALPNVAWIDDTPYDKDSVGELLIESAFGYESFAPNMVDKFPLYIHRINALKYEVRIGDQSKVRLGAYLGIGCVVMPGASYVNFNSAILKAIIEGRVSSKVQVGYNSDIGGGASTLGVLSGGNTNPITIGDFCLLEANSVLGIDLGDCSILSANCAIVSSTPVKVYIPEHELYGKTVKAEKLNGVKCATFRRNARSGEMEVVQVPRNLEFLEKQQQHLSILNKELHSNN